MPGTAGGNFAPSAISAYVDLPNGILSSRQSLTIEMWVTVHSHRRWQRLFDFGRMARSGMGTGAAPGEVLPSAASSPGDTEAEDNIMLSANRDTTANTQQLEGRLNQGTTYAVQTGANFPRNQRRHVVVRFEDGIGSFGASGGRLTWFLEGSSVGSVDVAFRLNAVEDVNNWLGRSQWTGDDMADVSYHELRIYSHAMTASEITASRDAGPDANFTPPLAQADSATMHRNQKVLLAVLANDSGTINTGTVEVVTQPGSGTATALPSGHIRYRHTSGMPASDSFTYRVSGPGGSSSPATVTISFSNQLRIPAPGFNVPSTPPTTAISTQEAFPIQFSQPLHMASPPGDARRLFVCEKGGLLRVIPDVTAATPTASTFLDLPAVLSARGESLATSSECGLLSVAFHPNYAVNRQFFTFYSVNQSGQRRQRVSRWTTRSDNPLLADTTSEQILINQIDEADNHNGGDLAFGPDGYLYISTGDEGGQNDQFDNGQTISRDFFSAILRIDPDRRAGNLEPNPHPAVVTSGNPATARYRVPADNPFVGATSFNGFAVTPSQVRTEFWAMGLRNPWRMSFDPVSGELFTGDVGGGQREEVNLIVRGGNYGWPWREGTTSGPRSVPNGAVFNPLPPLFEYNHGSSGEMVGRSISGGVVARNNRFSQLEGAYFFGDYVSSNVWSLRRNGSQVSVARVTGVPNVSAFGRDPSNNDILATNLGSGRIQRIVASDVQSSFPQTLTDTGLFADLADLAPQPGLLPYTVNRPFWSDHAEKRRWFALPDPAARFTWTAEGTWIAPAGALWVKHFDLETVRGNPASSRRIETRLFVRNATGAYGVSYRWNEQGTEATLVPDEGVSFDIAITENGTTNPQRWGIPSRTSCMSCHNQPAGFMLSFKTRQLNRDHAIHGFVGNQIDLLANAGYFSNTPTSPNTSARHIRPEESDMPIGSHVRSYLDVNCAFCHMPGGTTPGAIDLRESVSLAATGLVNGIPNNQGGNAANRLVKPGVPDESVLLHRVAASNGFSRMPPIASNVLDQDAIDDIRTWIRDNLPQRQSYDVWRVEKFGAGTPSGERTSDPDGDGVINEEEFLLATEPGVAGSFPGSNVELSGNTLLISIDVPADRIVLVETSTDLVTWTRWNVPGNNGLPGPPGTRAFSGQLTGERQFFRIVARED